MLTPNPLIGLITLLTMFLLVAGVAIVGRARGKYGIKAPATTGHEGFERAFRVQMNTQEATLMFLPSLWLAAAFSLPWLAAIFGAVWLLARVGYIVTYLDPAKSRTISFTLSSVATLALMLQALWGIAWTFILA